jgi:hypothetical protein
MAVTLKADPAYSDRWLASESEREEPKLGAQLTEKPDDKFTVYWAGHAARSDVLEMIDQFTEALESKRNPVETKLIAYGQDMRAEFELQKHVFKPLPKDTFIKGEDSVLLKAPMRAEPN